MLKNLVNNNERETPLKEREACCRDSALLEPLSFYEKIYYNTIRNEVVRCNHHFTGQLPLNNPNKYHLNLVNELYDSLDPELLFSDFILNEKY